jgi:hypothetical protein
LENGSSPAAASTRWSGVLGGAFAGAGAAILVARRFPLAPAAGQLPGYAVAHGIDPRREIARYVVFLLLVALGAWAGRKAIDKLEGSGESWRRRLLRPTPWLVLAAAPFLALTDDHWPWIAVSALLCFAASAAWPPVRRGSRLSLVAAGIVAQTLVSWSFIATTPMAKSIPLFPLLAVLVVWFSAIARGSGRRPPDLGIRAFSPSVLLVPLALWRTHPPSLDVAAAIAACAMPLAFALLPRPAALDGILRRALPVMLATAFVTLGGQIFLRPAPVAKLFEDGHALMPASEYLAGRLPYRDIVPGHGLFTDGLIQAAELRIFGSDYRGLARGDRLIGALYWPLIFCLGAAATGRVDVGFWSVALSFLLFPGYFFLRVMASFAVVAASAAARRRAAARSGWIVTGALMALSLLWAVEFAFYGAVAALVAVFASRGRRGRNLLWLGGGALAASAGAAAILAAFGILRLFFTTTFHFLPSLAAAYSFGFELSPSLKAPLFPDSLAALAEPISLFFGCLLLAIFGAAIISVDRRRAGERGLAILPFFAWFLVAAISFIERHHLWYPDLIAGAAVVLAARGIAGPARGFSARRAAALILVGWAVVISHPVRTTGSIANALSKRSPAPEFVYPTTPARLTGAAFLPAEAAAISSVGEFVAQYLSPGDTWLDFTSTPGLYFYFDRRCPVRYYEVAFYESPDAQQEVIRAIDGNHRVRAVLVHLQGGGEAIDEVPNSARAPLVWAYVQGHFHPAFASPSATFWLRNDSPLPAPLRAEGR